MPIGNTYPTKPTLDGDELFLIFTGFDTYNNTLDDVLAYVEANIDLVSSHADLTELDWTSSLHKGTANKLAGFDALGATSYKDVPIPFFDATVGTGGDYTTINNALNAGKRTLLLISNLTMTANTPTVAGGFSLTGIDATQILNCNGFIFSTSGQGALLSLSKLTLNTGTANIFSNARAIVYGCFIQSYASAYLGNSDITFINSYINVYTANFTNTRSHVFLNCDIFPQISHNFGGTAINCSFVGSLYTIINGYYYNCSLTLTKLTQPAVVENCLGTSVTIDAAAGSPIIRGSTFSTLNLTSTCVEGKITNNTISGTVTLSSDYHKVIGNNITGALTLNSGAEYNIISGNTLTAGYVNNSGNTTNVIMSNT